MAEEYYRLFDAVERNDAVAAEAVQQAIRDGANVNTLFCTAHHGVTTPLVLACIHGNDQIVGILLDAGADARWRNRHGSSAMWYACWNGHLSTVQLLFNHDDSLLETVGDCGWTPFFVAIGQGHSAIVRFLYDQGADPHHVDRSGAKALLHACREGSNLEIVRLLLAAGVDVENRDGFQETALHHAAYKGAIEVVRDLILQHNANMFVEDDDGRTPFDLACILGSSGAGAAVDSLLEIYGNKLTQYYGRLALHELLEVAKYSFAEAFMFHPPLNPLLMIRLHLGRLKLKHLRTVLHTLDPELIRSRDDTGKLPIHIACKTSAPVEVLALLLELDPTTLHIADSTGALPIHLLCGTTAEAEYASVRYLVEQGGVGTLAARDRQGLLPLHVLCRSTNPQLRAVQFLIQSFPGSVAVQTNGGQYPFMVAACELSSASLSVVYDIVRANPNLVVPR